MRKTVPDTTTHTKKTPKRGDIHPMNTLENNQPVSHTDEPEKPRLPYHAPKLVCLGSLKLLVKLSPGTGSDGSIFDCTSFNP